MTDSDRFGKLRKTDDGSHTIINPEIDEEYHSSLGAKFEALELYLGQSGYIPALTEGRDLVVLDVGLGLGYNALTTMEKWLTSVKPGNLTLLSIEKNRHLVEALADGTAPWTESWSDIWLDVPKMLNRREGGFQGKLQHSSGSALKWQVIIGDGAELLLPNLGFDFIWQDAFSPKKNPEMWSASWMKKLAAAANPQCQLMTYSVARLVKDSLTAAGWQYEKLPAPGNKRNWLRAKLG